MRVSIDSGIPYRPKRHSGVTCEKEGELKAEIGDAVRCFLLRRALVVTFRQLQKRSDYVPLL
jgi:hypothetical protein